MVELEQRHSEEPTYKWESIDSFVDELTNVMELGEMIHTEEFSLGEVMSAVEIMDPKMDGGFGLMTTLQLEELLETGAVLYKPTDHQAVDIMDQLLAAEFSWFSGYALPQTLYTCVYVHRPSLLHHDALSAYLKAVMKCCLITCAATNRADVREDEEFIPVVFNVDLGNEVQVPTILEDMDDILQELEFQAKQPDADSAILKALIHRMQYRKHYLQYLAIMTAEEHSPTEQVKEATEVLDKCQEYLNKLLGDRTPEFLGKSVNAPDGVFDNHCIRWVGSPSPMLPIQLLTWDQTQAAATKYLADLQQVAQVVKCQSLPQLLHYLEFFSERKPNVPARSFIWLMVYNGMDYRILNRDVLQNLILQSLETDYGAPLYRTMAHEQLPPLEDDGAPTLQHQQRDVLFRWCDKASSCIWLVLHALCSNRSRLRRKLANLFPEFGAWQHQSWETDASVFVTTDAVPEMQEVYTKCFVLTAYAYEIVLWAMTTYLLLGCELDLYKQSELQAIYWYIDYLISMRFENFGILHKVQDADPVSQQRQRGKSNKKKKPEPPVPAAYTTRVKTRPAAPVHITLEALYCLSRALFRFLAALPRDGVYIEPQPKDPLGKPALIFNNRIKPFLFLMRPHYVRYETYMVHSDTSTFATADLVSSALDLLKRCKMVLEGAVAVLQDEHYITGMTSLLKVTKANIVCLQLYAQGHCKDKEVELDWTVHPFFPVVKFRKKVEKAI